MPPGPQTLVLGPCRASHHCAAGHGLAAKGRPVVMSPPSRLGITLNLAPTRPASNSDADAEAALRVDGYANRLVPGPLFQKVRTPRTLPTCFHP